MDTEIMDEASIQRSLKRIAHEIIERNKGTQNLVLIGIKRRGLPLAEMIAGNIEMIEGVKVPILELDISYYRDDLSQKYPEPNLNVKPRIDYDLNHKTVVLVDDVIYTGRTVRSAMDAILDIARPDYIQLAVVIDRGHRELPIRPDFVGKNVPTSKDEHISVCVKEIDGCLSVNLVKNS